jgi:hypothetical protein
MLSNSILSRNSSGTGAGVDRTGGTVNADDNVFYQNLDSGGDESDCVSCSSNVGAIDANPQLAPLGNYGGITQTMLPLLGSPAICAGSLAQFPSGASTDQRGFPLTSCVDAGAVQTNYVLVSTTADSGSGSLRAALSAANSAGLGDIGFSSGVTGTIPLLSPLPTLTGQITLLGPGTGNLTLSGGGSTAVGSIVTVNSKAQLFLSGLTIANGNTGGEPGGGISNNGVLTVTNSSFNDNSSGGNAGGAINNSGTLMVSGSSFIDNSSSSGVGGIGGAINNSGVLMVDDSTFSANSSNNGGAICNSDGTATISDSANSSGFAGGGAIFVFVGAVTATNNIFVGNSARAGAGVATSGGNASANLSDNVFFNNLDAGGAESDCASCTSNMQAVDADPMLAPLGSYGGPTQTMLPLPGSAAICAGSISLLPAGTTTDQRGFARLNTSYSSSSCLDVGAVQTNYQSVQFTNIPTSGEYTAALNTTPNPAPAVSVTESGLAVSGVPVTLTDTGSTNSTVSGLGPVTTTAIPATGTTAASVAASFNVANSMAGDTTLSAALTIFGSTVLTTKTTAGFDVEPFDAPTNVLATAGNAQATVSFMAPASDGGSAITGYTVTSSPSGITATGSESPIVVMGLTNGTSYTFTVVAHNSSATGPSSIASNSVTPDVSQTITFTSTPPATLSVGKTYTVTASASSGLPVVFTIDSSSATACSIAGSVVTATAAGLCTVDANQAGNGSFGAATQVQQAFSVIFPVPALASISPSSGPTSGGTLVTISGSNFMGAIVVSFGGQPATSFTVNGATTITAISPGGNTGTVDVTVTTVGGTSMTGTVDQFTYFTPEYTVSVLSDDATGVPAHCVAGATSSASPNNNCSLRDAVAAADALPSGSTSTINFVGSLGSSAQPGTITLANGPLILSQNAAINGLGMTALVLDGNNLVGPATGNILSVNAGVTASVSNLTMQHATGIQPELGGGAYNDGTLTLTGVLIQNNNPNGNSGGAGIYNDTAGVLTVVNSELLNNGTSEDGGTSGYGGGIYNVGTLTMTGSTLSGNAASLYGGNLYTNLGAIVIENSTIAGSVGTQNGGGIEADGGTIVITDSTISGNNVATSGPGIRINGGVVTVTNSIVAGNSLDGAA